VVLNENDPLKASSSKLNPLLYYSSKIVAEDSTSNPQSSNRSIYPRHEIFTILVDDGETNRFLNNLIDGKGHNAVV
jgi:hypothetical protein